MEQGEQHDPGQEADKQTCQGRGGSLVPVTYGASKERDLQLRKPRIEHSKHLSLTVTSFVGLFIFLFLISRRVL